MAYEADQPSGNMPDDYDRILSRVMEQHEVASTRPAVYRQVPLFGIGGTAVFSIQTFRQAGDVLETNEAGDPTKRGPARFMAFLEVAKGERLQRHVLPHEVLDVILRQRDSLTAQAAKKAAQQAAKTRKARGIVAGGFTAAARKKAAATRRAKAARRAAKK